MRDVMMKAQELAEAILSSEIYQKMKQQEAAVRRDPEAAAALGDMIEKRNKVNQCFLLQTWIRMNWQGQAKKWKLRKSG